MAQTISHGEMGYRTAAMEPATARAFARCISRNATRFTNVELVRATTTKTEKMFVRFQPVNTERIEAIKSDQQEARAERAIAQPFLFWPDPDAPRVAWCYSYSSGETYQVTAADCTCPDHQFRCSRTGLKCKHRIARDLWRAEQIAAMIAQDF